MPHQACWTDGRVKSGFAGVTISIGCLSDQGSFMLDQVGGRSGVYIMMT
jgi:hypothetical protein